MRPTALLPLGLLGVLLAGTIALELTSDPAEPLPPPSPHAAIPVAATAAPSAEDHIDDWVETMLSRPLFSHDRKPVSEEEETATPAGPDGLPRLAGTLVGPAGRSAIFAATDGGKPRVIKEGGTLAGFTIRSIAPGEVTLEGPEGARTLHPTFDPNPPKPTPAVPTGLPPGFTPPGPPGPSPQPGPPPQPGPLPRRAAELSPAPPIFSAAAMMPANGAMVRPAADSR